MKKNIRGFLISKKSGAESTAGVSENRKESEEKGEEGSQSKVKKRTSAASRVNYKEMTDAQWFKLMDSEIESVEEEEEKEQNREKKEEGQVVDNEEFERKNASAYYFLWKIKERENFRLLFVTVSMVF